MNLWQCLVTYFIIVSNLNFSYVIFMILWQVHGISYITILLEYIHRKIHSSYGQNSTHSLGASQFACEFLIFDDILKIFSTFYTYKGIFLWYIMYNYYDIHKMQEISPLPSSCSIFQCLHGKKLWPYDLCILRCRVWI